MQLFKRLIAGMLVLVMCVGLIPLQTKAQENETLDASLDDQLTLHGTNDFGNLLSTELQETLDEEDDYSGDYGIRDLVFDGQYASVEYFTDTDAVLTVAVYTEDHLKMITSATVEVDAQSDWAEVTFQDELPQYFTATAFLLDGYDLSPLCASYSTSMYTENMQKLLSSTVEDYDPALVLNLDNDNTTNFAVYAEGTQVIPYREGVNKVVSIDHEKHIYVIENADERFTTLNKGDVISYAYSEGEFLIAKVGSITVDGTTVTIIGAELEMEEVFTHVKIEYDQNKAELTVDTTNMSPYVEFNGILEPPQTFSWEGGGTEERIFSYNLVEPQENEDETIKLSGTVNLNLKAEFSFFLSWGERRAKIELSATLDVTGTLEAKVEFLEIPLGAWFYGVPGLYIDFTPKLVLSLEGKVTIGGGVSFTFGVEYDKAFGTHKIESKPVWDITKMEAEVTFFFGIDFSPSVIVIDDDIADMEIGATAGLEIKASLKGGVNLSPDKTPSERHTCKACIDIQPKLVLNVDGKVSLLNWDKLTISLKIGSWARNFDTMYYSIDNQELGVGKCPNREYLVTVQTKNADNEPVAATIRGQYNRIWGTTNEDGMAQIYMRAGTHYLTASVLDFSGKTSISVPLDTKASFVLSQNPTDSTKPGYSSGGIIGGAIGNVDVEELIPGQIIAAGVCGLDAYWALNAKGKLLVYGSGEVYNYADIEPYFELIYEIEFADGITEIWNYPLRYMPNVTTMTLAGSVIMPNPGTFGNSESLETVILKNGIEEIGPSAFCGCTALKNVVLPETLKTIRDHAFIDCTSLETIQIPDSVTSMSEGVFLRNSSLKNVNIPSGVQTIPRYGFSSCTSLEKITIPSSVTTISEFAFSVCSSLTEIVIPDSVTTMGDYVFDQCTSLKQATLSKNMKILPSWTFSDCSSLTSIVIPDSYTGINYRAFYRCESLTDVTLGKELTFIGESVFEDCTNLKELVFGDKLTQIGWETFKYCTNLNRIVFTGNAPEISAYAFYAVETSVYYPANNSTWTQDQIDYYTNDCNISGVLTWIPYTLDASGNMVPNQAAAITTTADVAEALTRQTPELPQRLQPEIPETLESVIPRSIIGGNYGSDQIGSLQVKTASFTNLVPGTDYTLVALASVDVENPLATDNLLYIDQATAAADGTLKFRYIQRIDTDASYVFACGSKGQTLQDAVITFPTMYSSETPLAVVPTVTYHGKVLTEGWDYEISGEASYTVAGTYTCIIRGIYDYTGAVSCTYTVVEEVHTHTGGTATCSQQAVCSSCGEAYGDLNPANHTGKTELRNVSAAGCTTDGYTGDVYCLACNKVTQRGQVIPKGHRYENGACTVCGAADPDHVAPVADTVTRVFGADRYQTALKAADTLKEELGISKFQNIIVASGTDFPDALAGSYLASVKNAPILLVRKNNVDLIKAYIQKNLTPGGTVYLLGGTNAVPKAMETGLSDFRVERLGGATRYDTNLLILKEAGVNNQDIIVCTGTNFADSLSASAMGLPILLVKGSLTAAQKEFLQSTTGKKIIVGGTVAVNATVEKQLAAYGEVSRLAGATRYQTSVLVAETFFSNPDAAVFAYAQNFPDGLSGGPLAYAMNAPLILTANGKESVAVSYTTGNGIHSGYVLGGTGLISDNVVKKAFSMNNQDIILVK